MKIFITGGTGLIGRSLASSLLEAGHLPLVLTRSTGRAREVLPAGVELVEGDPSLPGKWMESVGRADAAVNLVGESIFGRWSAAKKEAIRRSRIDSTRNLVAAIPAGKDPPFILVSGSAVGYYGFRGEEELDESAPAGGDFLAVIAAAWEAAAREAEGKGARVLLLRSGIVLGKGGALDQMARPFKLGGGGPIGTGRQYLSWIHIDDEVRLIFFVLENASLAGPLNATSPQPVTNAEFARALGAVLHRPALVHVPSFTVRIVLGEFADAVLNGQRVIPAKALASGYRFLHGSLQEALADLRMKRAL